MSKLRGLIFIIIFLLITGSLSYGLIKYREHWEKRSESRDYQITKKLMENREIDNCRAAVFDAYGNEIFETVNLDTNEKGEITEVTRYETLKDKNGDDVIVLLNRRTLINNDLTTTQSWGIKEPLQMITKYYEGEIKSISKDCIVFFVKNESSFIDFNEHIVDSIKIKPYEKIINLKDYDFLDAKGPYLPPDTIYAGFRIIYKIDELKEYLGKYLYMQESFTTFYENSPIVKTLSFKELF